MAEMQNSNDGLLTNPYFFEGTLCLIGMILVFARMMI